MAKDEINLIAVLKHLENKLCENENVLIVGIPNVGKSTIINGLRHRGVPHTSGQSTIVGKLAGVTKSITGKIRIIDNPKVYCFDSPGIVVPTFFDPEEILKMAITGGIFEKSILIEDVASYLLHILYCNDNTQYLKRYGLDNHPNDLSDLLERMCKRFSCYTITGKQNNTVMCVKFLKDFRLGNFGRFTLDRF